jgi:mannose-6-phosphate isomerase-like protein (cupin superfamily)
LNLGIDATRESHKCVLLEVLSEGALLERIETAPLCGPPLSTEQRHDMAFLIVEGRQEFCIGDARALVERGDVVWVPRAVPHSWRALCVCPARMIRMRVPTRSPVDKP